jgi:hypothetical protein
MRSFTRLRLSVRRGTACPSPFSRLRMGISLEVGRTQRSCGLFRKCSHIRDAFMSKTLVVSEKGVHTRLVNTVPPLWLWDQLLEWVDEAG